ncbi:D-lactate dehydrogenase [Companilactobacillus mindensis DSM 14500]|uniref:D-lactate dehydrogenase n=1 Tax=Companilactobacillus mindensis DSM 14500 TaxID=1423770 RepID=A0A0R1QFR7_9LACO|nr:D-2-hydroxyacid dehydrogenase [Companilactobacillus mindensis]KRL43433.1 D-lactate dehydrogenase [Companilactobacillus mindensis DSM 14500]GEO79241.1 lactate dehydrogenase [Companilactobacillus mindensis]
MKIYLYGVREDEQGYMKEWSNAHPDVELDYTNQILTEETADLAKGYNGVVLLQTQAYTRAALEKLQSFGISKISVRNVGLDGFDFKDLRDLGFSLTNVPVYSPNAIAEHTTSLMLRLLRRVPEFDQKFANTDFRWFPTIGEEINGKTVGIIGTGHIGSVVARIMMAFGAKVVAYDIKPNPYLENLGIYVDTPDEVIEQADILTLHTPLAKRDVHMIDADAFAKMKDGVILINAARGGLVDTDALIAALDSGKVGGAGLDVLESENDVFQKKFDSINDVKDPQFKALINRDNVIITPHTAFYTTTAVHNMVFDSLNDNLKMLENKAPKYPVDITVE